MRKIVPFLWFDSNAEQAVRFYTRLFKKSKVLGTARYDEAGAKVSGRKKGSVMTVDFLIEGQRFTALNGGPVFSFTPAISFSVICKTRAEIDRLWKALAKGGKVLMPLAKYPFSERYGWLEDRYGVSWQLNLGKGRQKIVPSLMFVQEQNGKAGEAIRFYVKTFRRSRVDFIARYEKGEGDVTGNIKYAHFLLEGGEFIAMESGLRHLFSFTPAISFVVNCKGQREIDYLWERLSRGGKKVQCGWLEDRYGVSWQIVPASMAKLMRGRNAQKVMAAMLKMRKIDIKALERAAKG